MKTFLKYNDYIIEITVSSKLIKSILDTVFYKYYYKADLYRYEKVLKAYISDSPLNCTYSEQKVFLFIESNDIETLDFANIPFNCTVLLGDESLTPTNIIPEVLHHYSLPFSITKNNKFELREYTQEDFYSVYNMLHFSDQTYLDGFMTSDENFEKDIFNNHLVSYSFQNCGFYGIFHDSDLIGQIGINYHHINIDENPELDLYYELSYFIKSNFRKKGICKEYINCLINYFYETHNDTDIIYCRICKDNLPSIKTALSCNFTHLCNWGNNELIFTRTNIKHKKVHELS